MTQLYRKVYSSGNSDEFKSTEEIQLKRKAELRELRKARRKKFKRQTIEGHKREILARLSVPAGSLRKVKLTERTFRDYVWVDLILTVRAPRSKRVKGFRKSRPYVARQAHLQDLGYPVAHHKKSTDRIIRALYYLIDEGKLQSSINPLEWKVQQSLGISLTREIFLVQNLPDVSAT